MKKLLIGIFYGPHPIHKLWFDILAEKFSQKREISLRNEIDNRSSFLTKFFGTFFSKKVWGLLIGDFGKKVIFIEGFPHLIIWGYLFTKIRFVIVAADPLYFRLANNFFPVHIELLYRFFLRKVDIFLANSELVIQYLRKIGIQDERIIYMPPFIEENRRQFILDNKLFATCDNLSKKKLITIANGNDVLYKGIDFLDELAGKIKKDGWTIEVIGSWDQEIIDNFPRLRFLGRMDYKKMFTYLKDNCSLGIIVGEGETFSCAALEMGYMHIPVITRDTVGFSEIYTSTNETEFIIHNISDVETCIRNMNSEKFSKIGHSLFGSIDRIYTQEASVKRLKKELDYILGKN